MKVFEELTDAELVALTSEEINRYIDIECAESGVALLPPRPVKPEKPTQKPDTELYMVGTFNFTQPEHAARVAELVAQFPRAEWSYIPGNGYHGKFITEITHDRPTITTEKVYSTAAVDTHKRAIVEQSEAEKRYAEDVAEFTRIERLRDRAAEAIFGAVSGARTREMKRDTIRREFVRYLELADNRRRTAARFLEAAHPTAKDLCPELFEFSPFEPPDIPMNRRRAYAEPEEEASAGEML